MAGARTVRIGSRGKTGVPSGTAQISPVKRKFSQIVQEALVKDAAAAEIGEVVLSKMQIADILDHLLQTCRNGKAAAVRHIAEEDVKIA